MWKATADEPWVLKFSTCPLQKISDGSRGRARCLSQPSPDRQDGRPSVLISQNAPHVVSVLIFVNPAKMVDNPKLAFLAPMAGGQRFGDCSSADLAHFFNCLIQSNDLEGWFCGPQIHCITCRAPVTTRCFGCFLSLMTGATLKCKQFSCDLADEKVKNWGPQNVPPSFTEFETLEGAIKERWRQCCHLGQAVGCSWCALQREDHVGHDAHHAGDCPWPDKCCTDDSWCWPGEPAGEEKFWNQGCKPRALDGPKPIWLGDLGAVQWQI